MPATITPTSRKLAAETAFLFLPCQHQQSNRCRSKEHNARLHKRRRYTSNGCQTPGGRGEEILNHRKQNARHDPSQPEAGVVRFGKRQENAFFRCPKAAQRIPPAPKPFRSGFRANRDNEQSRQQNKGSNSFVF